MGWWWRSDPQAPVLEPSSPAPDPMPTPSQAPASARDVADEASRKTASPGALSREERADAELKAFLAEFEAAATPRAPASTANADGSTTTANADGTVTTTTADGTSKPSIYPTTMSCRQAFDAAFYCQSLGGQLNNVYRYGTLRSCDDHWSDFWFCMRIRQRGHADKARLIEDRYRQKEARYRSGPSSEDVWEPRRPGEELKDAFMRNPDDIDIPGLPRRRARGPA